MAAGIYRADAAASAFDVTCVQFELRGGYDALHHKFLTVMGNGICACGA